MSFEERLWQRVDKTAPNGCWLWLGALNGSGYGAVGRDNKVLRVHRVTYELLCCNPEHLEPVTNEENWRRGQHHTAVMLRENKCKRDHEMTAASSARKVPHELPAGP